MASARTRAHPQITARGPNVTTNSLNIWAGPETRVTRGEEQRRFEHHMGRRDAREGSGDLGDDLGRHVAPGQPAL
jgi:hypothetical protein